MGALRGASDAPIAPESEDRAIRAGFIDARARREYFQLALAAFLVSFMYSHAALLAVVFAREGFEIGRAHV